MNKKPTRATKPTKSAKSTAPTNQTQQNNRKGPAKKPKKSFFQRLKLNKTPPASAAKIEQGPEPMKIKKPASQSSAPINKKTDKELQRVMSEKSPTRKKRNFRGGNYSLYFIFAAIVIVVVLVILSNTVLFRCSDIEVVGNVRYTPEQIIAGSGLKRGDNLLHVDAKAAAKNVVDICLFVDEAEVRKSFPTKLIVNIKEAEICFCVSEGSTNAAVSRGGRVIKHLDFPKNAIVLKGYEPESLELGAWLKSKNETKAEVPWELLSKIEAAQLANVTEIDISDRYSLKVTVDNRIILSLGGATELESKFLVAKALIENEIGKNDSATISLINPEKPAVRINS